MSDGSTVGEQQPGPLNLTHEEIELLRALIQPQNYDTAEWSEEDEEALQSLDVKIERARR